MYLDSSVSFLLLGCLKDVWWFLYRCLKFEASPNIIFCCGVCGNCCLIRHVFFHTVSLEWNYVTKHKANTSTIIDRDAYILFIYSKVEGHLHPTYPIYILLRKIISITHHCYTFKPSDEYFWLTFAMKSDMEISPLVNFKLYG